MFNANNFAFAFFLIPQPLVPKKDYSSIENPECGIEHSKELNSLQIESITCNKENVAEVRISLA